MLNLLFISNSPKASYVKSALQPLLRVIIDVVPDFDHGLKDVFEKRPATVCIQDQIAGVTGESVARHIQMLLGSGAPRFILMHNGNGKVKPIKGLFEHLIDLNQTDADLSMDFQNTLQTLLGEQWLKIYIPPAQTAGSSATEPQQDADRLVSDLLQDFDAELIASDASKAAPVAMSEKLEVQSSVDEMADLLLAQASQARQDEVVAETVAAPEPTAGRNGTRESKLEKALAAVPGTDAAELIPDGHQCQVIPIQNQSPGLRQLDPVPPAMQKSIEPQPIATSQKTASATSAANVAVHRQKPVSEPVVAVPPAEFKISPNKKSAEETIPEDLLLAFEKNYRSKTTYMKRSVLALLLLLGVSGASLYAARQNPQLWISLKHLIMPASPSAVKSISPQVKPVQTGQMQPPVQAAPPVAAPAVLSFVPRDGYDSSYAVKNPGWERYVGKNSEVRVYKAGATIKAVQVLSVKGNSFSDAFLKSVLKELTGDSDYRINSRETKAGVQVLRGTLAQKADIIIYEKKSLVRAFVVSLN